MGSSVVLGPLQPRYSPFTAQLPVLRGLRDFCFQAAGPPIHGLGLRGRATYRLLSSSEAISVFHAVGITPAPRRATFHLRRGSC
jgi:hypothetical protein